MKENLIVLNCLVLEENKTSMESSDILYKAEKGRYHLHWMSICTDLCCDFYKILFFLKFMQGTGPNPQA